MATDRADAFPAGRGVYVISDAAELAGVHPQTLRIYERKGLLDPARTHGGSRRYSSEDLERLHRIQDLTACGFVNPDGARFCGQCGSQLTETAPTAALAEERKLATVLFADVVGFTTLADTTDPETVARTVDAAFRRMADVVAEHGGIVDKY